MYLEVLRFSSQKDSTLGALFRKTMDNPKYQWDLQFLCFTLEDEYRTKKVYGETRIPAGTYEIKLRNGGGFHEKYKKRYPKIHKGMLWLQDVPGFEYVLIHTGNKEDDTAGCLLVGDTSCQNITKKGFIGSSSAAYKRIYPMIAETIEAGETVKITYRDYA